MFSYSDIVGAGYWNMEDSCCILFDVLNVFIFCVHFCYFPSVMLSAYLLCGYNVGFWIQRLTVRTQTSVCSVLEQNTLPALLQSTQL